MKRILQHKKESDSRTPISLETRIITLLVDACRVLAEDLSESAYNTIVDLIAQAFFAESAVFFFINGRGKYSAVISGSTSPLRLESKEWQRRLNRFSGKRTSRGISPWVHAGEKDGLPFWLGATIVRSDTVLGWFKVGRASCDWTDDEEQGLVEVAETLASVIAARNVREREEIRRQRAEARLAESERSLKAFIEGSKDMIYTVDGNDRITDINAAGLKLLGGLKRTEVIGRAFSDFVLNPEDHAFLRQRIREKAYADAYEIVLKRQDGTTAFCVETIYTVEDSEGSIVEMRGIVKDITERIKNERELWRSNMELAEANKKLQQTQMLMVQREKLASIGQLAAGIAHEINNPLSFLKSNHVILSRFIDKLRGAWKDVEESGWPEYKVLEEKWDLRYISSALNTIFAESDEGYTRIMHIVTNLKNFARADVEENSDLYDINAGIESSIVVAWNELKFVAEVKKELGEVPQIQARGGAINQVILNIIVNAAQAIASEERTRKGTIVIRTYVKGENVVCSIADDGPGIPENIRLRIFDPFFTTKPPGKGTGLGLSISYDIIVNKHSGSLVVDSEPGKGTIFTIELPISRISSLPPAE